MPEVEEYGAQPPIEVSREANIFILILSIFDTLLQQCIVYFRLNISAVETADGQRWMVRFGGEGLPSNY